MRFSKMRWLLVSMSAVLTLSFLTSCSGTGTASSKPETAKSSSQPASSEPAKVTAYSYWKEFDDSYWNNILIQPLKKKYPNIDLQIIKPTKNGDTDLQKMIAAGETPDIVIGNVVDSYSIADYGFNYDMSAMIKSSKLDLSNFDPNAVNYFKSLNKGGIITIPYSSFFMALYYNKDIFDKFGAPYPKDGITFDEVQELARKMTREDGGTSYIGFDHNSINFLVSGITQGYFDQKTGKASLYTTEWKNAYNLLAQLIAIPGNRFPQDKDKIVQWHNLDFYKTQNVAMAGVPNLIPAGLQTVPDLRWDMTTYPVFSGYPKTTPITGGRSLFINPKSKVLDAAFKVVESSLSEEAQIAVSQNGEQPTLLNQKTIAAFCANLPYTNGKNVKSVFAFKQNWPNNPTLYDKTASTIVYNHSLDLYSGKDINTVIRETEDEINQKVDTLKSGQ